MEIIKETNEFIIGEQKKNRLKYFTALSVFLLMFFLRDIIEISINPLFFLIASTVLFIFFDREETIAFLIALPLLHSGFQYVYALGIGIIIYVVKSRNEIIITKYSLPFLAMFLWELLHLFIPPFVFYNYLKFITPFFLYVLIVGCKGINIDTQLTIKTLIYILLFLLISIVLITLIHYEFSLSAVWEKGFRLGYAVDTYAQYVLNANPNDLGFYCNLGIVSVLFLIAKEKREHVKIFLFTLIFVFIMLGLATLSRSFFVIFIFIVFYWFWITSKNNIPNKIRNVLLGCSLLILLIIIIKILTPSLYNSILLRFQVDDLTSGRNVLFQSYTKFLFSDIDNFIFGLGVQDYYDKVTRLSPFFIELVSHNGIQEIFVVWGIVGFIIVAFMFFSYFKSAKDKGAIITAQSILPFLIVFIKIQSGQFITAPVMNVMFVYAYVFMLNKMKGIENV